MDYVRATAKSHRPKLLQSRSCTVAHRLWVRESLRWNTQRTHAQSPVPWAMHRVRVLALRNNPVTTRTRRHQSVTAVLKAPPLFLPPAGFLASPFTTRMCPTWGVEHVRSYSGDRGASRSFGTCLPRSRIILPVNSRDSFVSSGKDALAQLPVWEREGREWPTSSITW